MRTDYFSQPTPRVLAHRGLTLGIHDENSLPALKAAMDAGIRYLEIDVRASRDGEVFVLHDDDLLRVAGIPKKVRELTAAELDVVRLNRGAHPLRLREALNHFPSALFNIDIKSADAIEPTRKLISELHCEYRVLLASFSSARGRAVSRGLTVATSAGGSQVLLAYLFRFWPGLVGRILRDVDALQIPTRFRGLKLDSRSFIEAVTGQGIEMHYWVINEPEEAKRLVTLGAAGIVSDRADVIAQALRL